MNDSHDLQLLFNSHIPIIYIETREELRALELIKQLRFQLGLTGYKWTITEGLVNLGMSLAMDAELDEPAKALSHIKQANQPGIYVLVDFHPYLNDPVHVRLIKDIALQYDVAGKTLVFISHQLAMPEELQAYSANFEMNLPGKKTIKQIVKDTADKWSSLHAGNKVKADKQAYEILVNNLAGLTSADVRRLANKAIFDDGAIEHSDIPGVMKAKYDMLNKDGILHFEYETEKFSDVGGFRNLKQWLEKRQAAFIEESSILDRPRGVLLLGIQGCGKSLAAKAVAGVWGVPLLRFDLGAMYNKYHGETERNLRETLNSAEVMAPCVLWIDEIEKALSSSDSDGGTSKRVLGNLLTWMAENKNRVFIVATANDIEALPPELIRKGRLDEIFFVDLPNMKTRMNIFEIHLRKRDEKPVNFDIALMAKKAEGFSGAEIEQAVVSALYTAHTSQRPLTDKDLVAELEMTRPLSVVMKEKIDYLRDWASERTVAAD
ncbi:MAG: AAA family ATPase [Thioalkalispiraceae bacterium]|jgi:SpoVK/Ycf46/Vps4 family AAA+-type ATPase